MSAEQTLLTHWRACVETRDPVCLHTFADHLMEQWDTAVAEDSAFYSETGAVAPVLRLEHRRVQLIVDHGETQDLVGIRIRVPPEVKRVTRLDAKRTAECPSAWDYEVVSNFAGWLLQVLPEPATLQERSSTHTGV